MSAGGAIGCLHRTLIVRLGFRYQRPDSYFIKKILTLCGEAPIDFIILYLLIPLEVPKR